jgi:hypothetical protein
MLKIPTIGPSSSLHNNRWRQFKAADAALYVSHCGHMPAHTPAPSAQAARI